MRSQVSHILFGEQGFIASTMAHAESGREPVSHEIGNAIRLQLWANGVLQLVPIQENSARQPIIISCGVHGNETAPIELLERLIEALLNQQVELRNPLLLIFANPAAAAKQVRELQHNMNRLFSGRHANGDVHGSLEAQRAAHLEQLVSRFVSSYPAINQRCLHYDLHTAIRASRHEKFAVYPLLHERQHSQSQLGFLERCGMQAVLLSQQPSGTFSYYTSTTHAAHGFTLELGSVQPFGQNDLSRYDALYQGLIAVLEQREKFAQGPSQLRVYRVQHEFIKRSEDMQFHFADDVPNFTAFAKGTLLVEDGEQRYIVANDGECIVFPNKSVAPGQRSVLIVSPEPVTA
ncbi:MAG: succinylglutamate desuccinylase [Gammaproteobacteria bacterium]|nr:succinylglutamate desuccinylase [Gammaproteobacteria bacterium]